MTDEFGQHGNTQTSSITAATRHENIVGQNAWTIAFWIKLAATGTLGLVSKWSTSAGEFYFTNRTANFGINAPLMSEVLCAGAVAAKWIPLIGWFVPSTATLGIQVFNTVVTGIAGAPATLQTTNALEFRTVDDGFGAPSASFDYFRLWKRVLTPLERNRIVNVRYAGLMPLSGVSSRRTIVAMAAGAGGDAALIGGGIAGIISD